MLVFLERLEEYMDILSQGLQKQIPFVIACPCGYTFNRDRLSINKESDWSPIP